MIFESFISWWDRRLLRIHVQWPRNWWRKPNSELEDKEASLKWLTGIRAICSLSVLQSAMLKRHASSAGGGKWGLETQTVDGQKGQLKFQCNDVSLTDTCEGNQTHKISKRQGNMPKMCSWYKQFANCCAKTLSHIKSHSAVVWQMENVLKLLLASCWLLLIFVHLSLPDYTLVCQSVHLTQSLGDVLTVISVKIWEVQVQKTCPCFPVEVYWRWVTVETVSASVAVWSVALNHTVWKWEQLILVLLWQWRGPL